MLPLHYTLKRYGRFGLALTALPFLSALLPGLVALSGLAACDATKSNVNEGPPVNGTGSATAGGSALAAALATSAGPQIGTAGGIIIAPPMATRPALDGPALFAEREVRRDQPARRVLYSWTTPEQILEIQSQGALLTRSERSGQGRGHALDALAAFGATDDPAARVAAHVTGPDFSKVRYAWAEAWATRLGWPGETYGNQLLRIVLRPDAWLVTFREGSTATPLDVMDLDGHRVSLTDALVNPERLAGVFFSSEAGECQGGSFRPNATGYREFVVFNEAMIEEWSIAGSEAEEHLSTSIDLLTRFLEHVRTYPEVSTVAAWTAVVACLWRNENRFESVPPSGEHVSYARALAIPSAGYLPDAPNLATLIETLTLDLAAMRNPTVDAAVPSSTVPLEMPDADIEQDTGTDAAR